jgi:glycosyltransferase involved in cell wall biosynthesis
MVRRILHISNSPYRSLTKAGPSYQIFKELAQGADEYHVLGQSLVRSFSSEQEGNLHFHLLPTPSAKTFSLLSYHAAYLIRKYAIDGVISQDPILGGVAAFHCAGLFRIPLMVEVHTDVYFRYLRSRNPVLNAIGWMACHVLRRATRVRALDQIQADLFKGVGVPPGRIAHIPYRVDTGFFQPGVIDRPRARRILGYDGEVLIVSVGRFVEQKGFIELLSAFKEAKSMMPALRLVIVGGGPLEGAYRSQISRDRLAGGVRLLPWLSHQRVRELLGAADVYAQPSLPGKGDWMPRAILEAMAMGLPVVASSVGGIPEVVRPGRNGVLVPPADIERLRSALLQLSADADVGARLGEQGRRDVSKFYAWADTFERYRKALYSLDAAERPTDV